jgi:hypothetical protein
MEFAISERCPKCGKPVGTAIVERHPTRTDVALYSYECAACGPVKTKVVSLRPGKGEPEKAA